jgi:hypothetical protein
MTPLSSVILAYVVATALLWGYAIVLAGSLRSLKNRSDAARR